MPGKTRASKILRLGTRQSQLALWQATWTKQEVERQSQDLEIALVPIKTRGDRILDVPLAEVGGKGLFTKELDEALLEGRIDFAVHSLKDLPFELPAGIELAAITRREDPRDAFVSDGRPLNAMPKAARIGTSSLRRQAQLRHLFPDLEVVPMRGNVDTRLAKLDRGDCDGVLLAAAGLKRLGHAERISEYLEPERMLPAIGQGALAIVSRSDDMEIRQQIRKLEDVETRYAVSAERALLGTLQGDCQVPLGGHARVDSEEISLDGLVASPDGKLVIRDQIRGEVSNSSELGSTLGQRLRDQGAGAILEALQSHGR